MEHYSAREKTVLGETIRVNSNLFYDGEKRLIKDKRVLIYITDTVPDSKKEISASAASLAISVPELGTMTHIAVPFKSREEEERDDLKGIVPNNWAALCLSVGPDAVTGKEEL